MMGHGASRSAVPAWSQSADSVFGCRGAADGPECARFVPESRVVGPVVLRFWPLGDLGPLPR